MCNDLRLIERALNYAVGTSIFYIKELSYEREYKIELRTKYDEKAILTDVVRLHILGEYEEAIKTDARTRFYGNLFKSLIYGLPLNKVTDINGIPLYTIQNFIIQEELLKELRDYFGNNFYPMKPCEIYGIDNSKIKILLEHNTIHCSINKETSGSSCVLITKDINSVQETIGKLKDYIYGKR